RHSRGSRCPAVRRAHSRLAQDCRADHRLQRDVRHRDCSNLFRARTVGDAAPDRRFYRTGGAEMSVVGETDGHPMSLRRWMLSFSTFFARPWVRIAVRTVYYLAILIGLLLIYGKGDFSTPPFIYQGS